MEVGIGSDRVVREEAVLTCAGKISEITTTATAPITMTANKRPIWMSRRLAAGIPGDSGGAASGANGMPVEVICSPCVLG